MSLPVSSELPTGHRRAVVVLCSVLVAAPWFWPVLLGPLSAMWPDLTAWTAGALLIALLPRTVERATLAVASGWLAAALGSAVLGLIQYFDLENGFFPWIAPTLPGYVTANVHQLNMLATLLAVGLLCVAWLLHKRHLARVHAVWMSGLLLVALAATASRTGLVHLVAISCMLLYWYPRHWRRTLLILVAGWATYALAAGALPWLVWVTRGILFDRHLLGRFGEDVSCQSRLILWNNMLELIALKPWTGWGAGEVLYAHYITDYSGPRFCDKLSNAHNLPLHLAVTMGVPVAATACVLFLVAVVKLRPWAATDAQERMNWSVLALIGLHSLLEYPLWFGVFQLMAALAAWQIHLSRRTREGVPASENSASARVRWLATTVLVAGLSYVAWDYHKVSQLYLPERLRMESFRQDTFNKSRDTVFFKEHVLIAQVVITELTPQNAELILAGALTSLHVAPDSRVIRRVLEAAAVLGRDDLVALHEARYKAAWPKLYKEWKTGASIAPEPQR